MIVILKGVVDVIPYMKNKTPVLGGFFMISLVNLFWRFNELHWHANVLNNTELKLGKIFVSYYQLGVL